MLEYTVGEILDHYANRIINIAIERGGCENTVLSVDVPSGLRRSKIIIARNIGSLGRKGLGVRLETRGNDARQTNVLIDVTYARPDEGWTVGSLLDHNTDNVRKVEIREAWGEDAEYKECFLKVRGPLPERFAEMHIERARYHVEHSPRSAWCTATSSMFCANGASWQVCTFLDHLDVE